MLILSHDVFNERSGTVIAMPLTSQSQPAGYPLTWQVPLSVLPKQSWIKISQVRTLSTERLGDRLGQLAEDDLRVIVDGLTELIG